MGGKKTGKPSSAPACSRLGLSPAKPLLLPAVLASPQAPCTWLPVTAVPLPRPSCLSGLRPSAYLGVCTCLSRPLPCTCLSQPELVCVSSASTSLHCICLGQPDWEGWESWTTAGSWEKKRPDGWETGRLGNLVGETGRPDGLTSDARVSIPACLQPSRPQLTCRTSPPACLFWPHLHAGFLAPQGAFLSQPELRFLCADLPALHLPGATGEG